MNIASIPFENLKTRLDIVSYFSQSMFRRNTVEGVAWDITSNCINKLDFEDCMVYLIDEKRETLVQKSAYGNKNIDDQQVLNPIEIPVGEGIVGTVFKTGIAEIIPDTLLDDRYILDDIQRRSEIAVPITAEGQIIGVIDSEHSQPSFYQQFHLDILTDIASISGTKLLSTIHQRARKDIAVFASENPNPLFRLSADFEISLSNPPADQILAVFKQRSDERKYAELYSHVSKALSSKSPQQATLSVAGIVYSVDIIPFPQQAFVNLYLVDVTAYFKAKEAAEQANKAKTDFMGMMSHEIRTPLNGILNIGRILRKTVRDEQSRSLIDSMEYSGENLLRIINEILEYDKIAAGKLDFDNIEFDVRELIGHVIELLGPGAAEKNTKLYSVIDENIPQVLLGDLTKLMQVFDNLVQNAVKFTENGEIIVQLEVVGQQEDRVQLAIHVSDTGRGIPTEKLDTIFDKYAQIRPSDANNMSGFGMGLSITKQLVEKMGGEISVQSTLKEKTVFTIKMDFEIAGLHQATPNGAADLKSDFKGIKVLIVDDSAINRLVAEEFLTSWNVIAVSVEDGKSALKLAQTSSFDLILMDLQMPGWSGYKTAGMIREHGNFNKTTPIIAISADVLSLSEEAILDAGMNDALTKPYHPDELQRKIKYLLSLAQ